MELTLLGLAVAPGVAIAIYVYFRDRYEKEPLKLLVQTFLAGFLAVTIAAVVEVFFAKVFTLDDLNISHVAINNFFFIGFTEEVCKYYCLYKIAYSKPDFNEPFDGIVYAVMISMGFATSENILYVMNGGIGVAFMRIFTAVPAHATFGVMMGYFVGLAKFRKQPKPYLFLGLTIATIFHGAYDFFLSVNNIQLIALGALVSLIIGIIFSMRAMKILSEHSPFRYSTIILQKNRTEQS
ncbi:MAG: PrsW family glutamic-type intramembrane protease [Bacteroidota bacterium]|nr:PrsW family glutamic-type intramembrane protease [Bacteroidota bacterium]